MAAKKQPPRSAPKSPSQAAGARGSDASSRKAKDATKTTARSTMSGPARRGTPEIDDGATAKLAGTEALAASFPHNAAKPSEFGRADAMQPATGQAVEPPHPMVTGSTLTETNASEKV